MEHEHMVQALAPNRTNDALDVGSLPGGSRGGQDFLDSHIGCLAPEISAEDGVAIAEQIARELVKGKGFSQLLSRPRRRRMRSHIEMDNATPVMGQLSFAKMPSSLRSFAISNIQKVRDCSGFDV